jgi:hypothetical protein
MLGSTHEICTRELRQRLCDGGGKTFHLIRVPKTSSSVQRVLTATLQWQDRAGLFSGSAVNVYSVGPDLTATPALLTGASVANARMVSSLGYGHVRPNPFQLILFI